MTLATCKPRAFVSISFYLFCQPSLHLCTRETCAALVFGCIWGTPERALWLVSPLACDNRALIARVLTCDVISLCRPSGVWYRHTLRHRAQVGFWRLHIRGSAAQPRQGQSLQFGCFHPLALDRPNRSR